MSDERIEQELQEAAQLLDPVPPHLVDAAIGAFTWRTIDADLAELVYDSLAEPVAAVRSVAQQPRLLTFQTASLTIELEAEGHGENRRIVGRVIPAEPVTLEIRHSRGVVTASIDTHGRFAAGALSAGPIQLRLQADRSPVVTDWFNL